MLAPIRMAVRQVDHRFRTGRSRSAFALHIWPIVVAIAALFTPVFVDGVATAQAVNEIDPKTGIDPYHRRPLPGMSPRVPYPRVGPRRVHSQLVYIMTEQNVRDLTDADPELSRLCGRGAFGQVMDGWLYARTDRRRYGVAFANGANLHDPRNRRREDSVYFVRNQDTPLCEVRVAQQGQLVNFAVTRR